MKKLLLATLAAATLLAASTQTQAQTQAQADPAEVKNSIMEFLRVEGYVPSLDTDGDIAVKVAGTSHYIRIYDRLDSGLCYLELYCIYTVENTTLAEIAWAANEVNQTYRAVRVSYSPQEGVEGEYRAMFETPCYVADGSEFNRLFGDYIGGIDSSSDRLYALLRGEE
jgi:hypothetical protein